MNGAHRAAVLGKRLGGGAALRRNQVADGLAGKIRFAAELGQLGIHPRTLAGRRRGDHREQLVARTRDVELQLAVLVNRSERADRRRALAALAEALGPELHIPLGEERQPIRIGHHHRYGLVAVERSRERRSNCGRHFGRRLVGQNRGERVGGACADRTDVEAAHRGGQKPHIAQHREAAADTRIMVHHRDVVRGEQRAQTIALAGLQRLGDAEKMLVRIELQGLHGIERRDGLHQRLAGAAGFRHRDKAAGLERQSLQQRGVALGIEIVHEMDARRIA